MTNAKRDNNQTVVASGVLNTDGATPTPLQADPATHILSIDDNVGGSDNGGNYAKHDQNQQTSLIATDANGNKIALYVNSLGKLLIDTA